MSDEKRLPFAGYTTQLVFGVLLAREQAPDWGWGGDGREKIGERSEPRIVVWGGERVVEPGGAWIAFDAAKPPCSNLLCQDVKFSRMSA